MLRAAEAVQHRDKCKYEVQALAAPEEGLQVVLTAAGDCDDLAIQPRCRRQQGNVGLPARVKHHVVTKAVGYAINRWAERLVPRVKDDVGPKAEQNGGTLFRGGEGSYMRAAGACELHCKMSNAAAGPAYEDTMPGGNQRAFDSFPCSDRGQWQGGCVPESEGARLTRQNARIDKQILSQRTALGAAYARTESIYGVPDRHGLNVIREGHDATREIGTEDCREVRRHRRALLTQLAVNRIDARRGDLNQSAPGPEPWSRDVAKLEARDVSESGQHLSLHGGHLD
jgi:hypothetical protein